MHKDTFNRYQLRLNPDQAKLLLLLVNSKSWTELNVAEVLDLNMLTVQLEEIIEEGEKDNV